ncbi:outer membrane protein assembly factor [Methylomonas sp. EFPC1]|uniref:autotransporter assembly complex protein TamA n=1 Tax=Methylomonas sp. EFPC1 TaxID=2812647 RepID=UPI00196845DA|nr:autotransporter assembly complex family protein [Methylomonas sp. EFPC1]QSB02208.1 outer membrane protein assembly factor [Methylomonas sp. EFPC1]
MTGNYRFHLYAVVLVGLFQTLEASADVLIQGIDGELLRNVEISLSLREQDCKAPDWKINSLFLKADQEIDDALRALGYYHVSLEKNLDIKADCWQARFVIKPGEPMRVTAIDVQFLGEAVDDPAFASLREKLSSKVGSPLHHGHYEALKKQIEALALERGYLQGRFTSSQLRVDPSQDRADIVLHYDAGPRLYFGEVKIDQAVLDPAFVAKLVKVKTGEHYDSHKLADTHNALSNSGYFKSVDIHPDLAGIADRQVPVMLSLYPNKRHHYGMGLGYDTDKGPLVSGTYLNRLINPQGHYFNAELDLSPVLATAGAEYTVPLDDPLNDSLSFGAGVKREDTTSYTSWAGKLSARLKHAFTSGWKQTLFIDYSYEKYTAANTTDTTLLLLPGGSWLRSVSDNPLRPTRGYRLEFSVDGSYKSPLSNISMLQGAVAGVWMHPVGDVGRILLRGEQGATLVDNFDKLPTTYRYFAGGMNSIRGYSYKELGPKDATGAVVGGRFLSVVSVEYEHSVLDNWGAAAFIDAGNAYNLDGIQIKTGVGLGVRWYSPIGLVRLDFAVPLQPADSSFQIHFAAGTRL